MKIKTKNQTLLLCQIGYYQHSSEVTMQSNFFNKSMFIMQSETKCNQEGAWLYFKRKCTQEWVWKQKQLWYLLDCHPQPLLPKHAEWMGLVPCVLGCRPNFLTQGRLTGPTTPVLSGQSWSLSCPRGASGRDWLKTKRRGLHFRGVCCRRRVPVLLIAAPSTSSIFLASSSSPGFHTN